MSQNPTKHTKVLIIGSGPAGYTAAIYAARAMLNPILVYGSEPGGQLTTTTDVENFPGFADVIQGPWLMDQMKEQAKVVGTEMIEDHINSVDLKKTPFEAVGDTGQKYTADSIIISTGAQARWLNLKSEQEFRGFGVSACATCDGFFFKDKEVAVVGGGNAAVEEAMFLTKFASKVKLIHRRDNLRAEKMLQKKLMDNKKIEIIWDSVVEDVIGDKDPKNVKGIKIKNVKTNKIGDIFLFDLMLFTLSIIFWCIHGPLIILRQSFTFLYFDLRFKFFQYLLPGPKFFKIFFLNCFSIFLWFSRSV